MELSQEEKTRIEAQETIKRENESTEKQKNQITANKGCLGCFGLIVIIFVISLLSGLFKSGGGGKEWSDVQYEVQSFYQASQIEDGPDRKVWMGKVREGSLNLAKLTAIRLPNGKWKTDIEWINVAR